MHKNRTYPVGTSPIILTPYFLLMSAAQETIVAQMITNKSMGTGIESRFLIRGSIHSRNTMSVKNTHNDAINVATLILAICFAVSNHAYNLLYTIHFN